MATSYEVKMYSDLSSIARSLDIIASCMQARETRERAKEERMKEFTQEQVRQQMEAPDE